jgi:hypothetical protein
MMPGFLHQTIEAGERVRQWRNRKRECERQSIAGSEA